VNDRKYNDSAKLDSIEDAVWESGNNGATNLTVHHSKHLGELLNRIEGRVGSDKLFAQTGSLLFIPSIDCSQVPPNIATEDNWSRHLASPSFG
jgi:hypothetical protein